MKKIITLCFIALTLLLPTSSLLAAEVVVYNTKTHIYHTPSCNAAKSCTKNCIKINKQEAEDKGGRPCMRCGG